MFGLGTTELIIILVILVMVFGLGKLPNAAKQIGSAVGSFREGMEGKDDEIQIDEAETGEDAARLEDQQTDQQVRDASVTGQEERERSADGGTW